MATASNFLIGANDEHGLNPPTPGKRTPVISYLGRSFYENEFNRQAKLKFMEACLRCGFRVYDVHPEVQDVSVSQRVVRANRANLSLLVTYAYNASGDGTTFNNANGLEVYYSPYNVYASESRSLANEVYENILAMTGRQGRFVGTISIGVLTNVRCPSVLVEAGFMTNREEAKLMLNPNYVLEVAEGTAKGVCEFLDVPYVERTISNFPTLKLNDSSNFVTLLQYLLNEFGANLSIDGKFGGNTRTAVINFQKNNNLTQDGIVGPNTWTALLNLNPTSKVLRRGEKSSAVLYLQRLLLSYLYPITDLDGIFGPETERAVKSFQAENGLTQDGVVGPRTWSALLSSTGRSLG